MGLAPYGEPKYVDQFRRLVDIKQDGSFTLNLAYFSHHYSSKWTANNAQWETLFGFPRRESGQEIEQRHEDLARSGQAVVEEIILNLAREARRASGSRNLVIAGGVGLNSVANWKIEHEGIFDNVWIQPAAGDDGGAAGAALLASHVVFGASRTPELTDAYLGPEYTDAEIEGVIQRSAIPYERFDDQGLVERAADLIAAGKVIGWFRGRMEFGPRALGARSILADATNPEMKAVINQKIKYREYFRPFAPAVPLEDVHRYFEVPPGTSMPFMLKVPRVRPEAKARIPAVTHEDGSGRVQTVTRDGNPLYYDLLKAVERRTGVPIVVNTSFNVRGEPIVCSPQDAINCFFETGIDALVLGNCLLTEKPGAEVDVNRGYARSDALEADIGSGSTVAPLHAPRSGGPSRALHVSGRSERATSTEISREVLDFYKRLPFNFYSNAVDEAVELMRSNRIKEYPAAHSFLKRTHGARVIDVGCGAGWFANSCAHFYDASVTALDLNPVALRQAKSVARLIPQAGTAEFVESNVFEFEPRQRYALVNSLGVLHHTPDCHGAIRRVIDWIEPGGYLHLGLYHRYGRKPFLEHFKQLIDQGHTEEALYAEFKRLNWHISDETHLRSWFRDQVIHPHESQHTYEEIEALLRNEGCVVKAVSFNRFKRLPPVEQIIELERRCEQASLDALHKKHCYYPGFFVVWAQRT
jgi:predicted NodU family carbamoyl transferase/2-polyprenyl-3-methyl-5-hydroxy-6-metoxy-1,4-benzoquinol methylase